MSKIIKKIQQKLGYSSLLTDLCTKLSGTEFNSLMLELFRERTNTLTPAQLLQQFSSNRFVLPALVDPLAMMEMELEWLRFAKKHQFQPLALSPLAPLGSCAVVGEVDQNKVVSALRGTEVVSDATNVLALQIAQEVQKNPDKDRTIRYAAVHRHVRGQSFDNPAFSAHFGVFCLASGGFDSGNYRFEAEQLREHLWLHYQLLARHIDRKQLIIKLFLREKNESLRTQLEECLRHLDKDIIIEWVEHYGQGDYYQGVQYKIYWQKNDQRIDVADGGVVDWSQKLLSNRKHRLFISGTGLELVHKLTK
uniref:Uncharacterized protein n=1 Tax=Roseihalotalea indica TaxID=2867963 RepID=A0AA49GNH1_9BACT|nr:hypothetical protein K4G66_01780 [Tunicatimonas sp. TK19036]